MRCPGCKAELSGAPKYCSECGYYIKSGEPVRSAASGSEFPAQEDLTAKGGEGVLKPPSGFSRTLSTELVARQMELRALVKLGTLIQSRTYRPGEVVRHAPNGDGDGKNGSKNVCFEIRGLEGTSQRFPGMAPRAFDLVGQRYEIAPL